MLVNAAAQSHFKFDRLAPLPMASRKSPTTYHRRTVSCLAVASYHEHYNHPAYLASGGNNQLYDTIIPEGSASPVHHQTRHAHRKSEGAISLDQLQKGLSGAGVSNVNTSAAEAKENKDATNNTITMPQNEASERPVLQSSFSDSGCFVSFESPQAQSTTIDLDSPFAFSTLRCCQCSDSCHRLFDSRQSTLHFWASSYFLSHLLFSNRPSCVCIESLSSFQKLNVGSPVNTPRRSLLSDLLNNQAAPTRLEQNANRRRMLKSMRRYSVDASEMDFTLGGRPSSRGSPLTTISSEGEGALLIDSHQGFNATPTVRYLRNPCHAAVKTKLMPSAYRGSLVRRSSNGKAEDEETPDYFASEDRVW
ncbi:hypothetical protein BKA57DRAFT_438551 [Linnemannia elongata]|nr:hypothetical protein BKA57DRAFT_438551 [Linnemannia elongata]